eukprot:6841987-Prorocentrum_lima.AAC.1
MPPVGLQGTRAGYKYWNAPWQRPHWVVWKGCRKWDRQSADTDRSRRNRSSPSVVGRRRSSLVV